jgi:hypothetical protein
VAASLAARLLVRGELSPGWDFLGPAQGLYLLGQHPFPTAVAEAFRAEHSFLYWNPTNSPLYTLLPGGLARLWPWAYWGHLLTFACVLASLALAARSSRLPRSECFWLLLAWGASPALLSFAIAGYPYAAGVLPHALALFLVSSDRLRRRPLLTLVLALCAVELSWHVYEAGKTLIVVFVAAALLERAVPLGTRAAWLLASAVQVGLVAWAPGGNVDFVLAQTAVGRRGPIDALGAVLAALGHGPLGELPVLDLPFVTLAGLAALPFFRRGRGVVLAGLLSQLGALVVVAQAGDFELRPRRYLTVTFYAMVALFAAAAAELGAQGRARLVRRALIALLVLGNLAQVADLARFTSQPLEQRRGPLPFTASQSDYGTFPLSTAFARTVAERVRSGRQVLLVYGPGVSVESTTDPAGVLERLHLELGDPLFSDSVLLFADERCRYSCVPARPLAELPELVTRLAAGLGPVPAAELDVLYRRGQDGPAYLDQSMATADALLQRFDLLPAPDPVPGFGRLRLAVRPGPRPRLVGPIELIEDGRVSRLDQEALPLDLGWSRQPVGRVRSPTPVAVRVSLPLEVDAAGPHTLLLGLEGTARISVDGGPALQRSGFPFLLRRDGLELRPGVHRLQVDFAPTDRARARLLLDLAAAPR